jgi:hypothetical protein
LQKEKQETKAAAAPPWTSDQNALLIAAVADVVIANRRSLYDTPGLERE